jgi:hypothetical protein
MIQEAEVGLNLKLMLVSQGLVIHYEITETHINDNSPDVEQWIEGAGG